MVTWLGGLLALLWGALLVLFLLPTALAATAGLSVVPVVLIFSPVFSLAFGFWVGVQAYLTGRARLVPLLLGILLPVCHLWAWVGELLSGSLD